jgi:hypothetical protein
MSDTTHLAPERHHRGARRFACLIPLLISLASAPVLAVSFGSNASCVAQRGGNSCTANDLTFVLIGLGVQSDGCLNIDDTVTINLGARIRNSTAQVRYDVGIFIDRSNVSAYSGIDSCAVDTLENQGALNDFTCGTGHLNLNGYGTTLPGDGPFLNTDGDTCGDLQNRNGSGCDFSPVDGNYDDSFQVLAPLTLSCRAGVPTGDGYVHLATCLTWGNNSDEVGNLLSPNKACNGRDDVEPGTPSKCACNDSQPTDVPLPNLRQDCTSFDLARTLDANEVGDFSVDFSNIVAGCTPGAATDPFGRFRCGTAGFVRFVIDYKSPNILLTTSAEDYGTFYISNPLGDIPVCPATLSLGTNGEICDDTTSHRLIWSPKDTRSPNALTVISPTNSGTLPFHFKRNSTNLASGDSIEFRSNIYWDNDVDTNTANGTIIAAESVDLTGAVLQTCADCACSTAVTTTPVTISSFRATPAGNFAQFDWSTETEVGNIGFNLYARVGRESVRLNEQPIPTKSTDSLEPQSYSAFLPMPDGAESFLIEDLDVTGGSKAHGPYKLDRQYGARVDGPKIDWNSIRRDNGLAPRESARLVKSGRKSGALSVAVTTTASVPSAPVELWVDQTGLYRVTYEQFLAAGFDFSSFAATGLGLTARGKPVPIYINTAGKFGPGSYFEFWGDALNTIYTKTNVYRLLSGQKKPARAAISTSIALGTAAATYTETRRFERNLGYAMWASGPDPFFDSAMLVYSSPGQWSFPFSIDGLAPSGGSAHILVEGFGSTTWSNFAPDHHIQFLVNGTLVGESFFDGDSRLSFSADFAASALTEGANTLTLRLPADTGAPYDMINLDGFSVSFPRDFAAQGGRLILSGNGPRFDVTGLPTLPVVGYRRDSSGLTRLSGLQVNPDGGNFRATIAGSSSDADYEVASDSGMRTPSQIRAGRASADITTGPASYLVISHAAFMGGLQPLLSERTSQGYSVKLVDVEDVYSRFSGGVFDAVAIRDYISYAYRSMGTRFVLLVGGDSYDYLNYLGANSLSFIPTLYRDTGETIHFAPSDASFADIDGDGLQDLAIGRFPVKTTAELAEVVAKTLQYDQTDYVGTAVFAADSTDAGANESFQAASERLVSSLPASWQVDRIYADQLTLSDARTRLFSDLANGAGFAMYLGHSGQTSWGSPAKPVSQRLFTINDVPLLTNQGKPTVIAQFGCLNVYFVHPRTPSLGSSLVLAADRGAAAVMGSTTVTEDAHNNRFGTLLTPLLTTDGKTIGEAIWQAKRLFASTAPTQSDLRDILLAWTLLGDPAIRIAP